MNFDLASKLDVLPYRFSGKQTPCSWDDEDIHSAEIVSLYKSGHSAYQERASTKKLETILPSLANTRELSVPFRTSRSFFESICQMPSLERLTIYQPCQYDLEPIANLQHLTHLSLGTNPNLDSLEPLKQLKKLVVIGIDGNYKQIKTLDTFGDMVWLRGLAIVAPDAGFLEFPTLDPLSGLRELEYLCLAGLRTGDKSLRALCRMQRMQCLHIIGLSQWPKEQYELVHRSLPNLEDEELRLAATDPKFQRQHRIR
ncbi:MAG: hypothetical protein AAGI44_11505 [Pseudomonadota bacterium]